MNVQKKDWIQRQEEIDKIIITYIHYAMRAKRDYDNFMSRIDDLTREYEKLTSDNVPF